MHQMAYHFNSLHFLGQALENVSKMLVVRQQGNRLSISGLLESASMQKICYDRGRELKGLTAVAWLCPQSTPDRHWPAWMTHPTVTSIPVFPGEVTVHRMTSHFISLHIAFIWWVTRKGDHR